jgi:transcriptional regulator with XRE-family HTH domain
MVVGKAETRKLREQIGRQFRQARLAAGLSQVKLAVEIGTSSTYVSEIESGYHNITLDTLAGVAGCLGLDVKVVLTPKSRRPKRGSRK